MRSRLGQFHAHAFPPRGTRSNMAKYAKRQAEVKENEARARLKRVESNVRPVSHALKIEERTSIIACHTLSAKMLAIIYGSPGCVSIDMFER